MWHTVLTVTPNTWCFTSISPQILQRDLVSSVLVAQLIILDMPSNIGQEISVGQTDALGFPPVKWKLSTVFNTFWRAVCCSTDGINGYKWHKPLGSEWCLGHTGRATGEQHVSLGDESNVTSKTNRHQRRNTTKNVASVARHRILRGWCDAWRTCIPTHEFLCMLHSVTVFVVFLWLFLMQNATKRFTKTIKRHQTHFTQKTPPAISVSSFPPFAWKSST